MNWQEWETELLNREREWEKHDWLFYPADETTKESRVANGFWWGVVLLCAAMALIALVEVLR
jgi:hypothetical protein